MLDLLTYVKIITLALAAFGFAGGIYGLLRPVLRRLHSHNTAELRHQARMKSLGPKGSSASSRWSTLPQRWHRSTELMLKVIQGDRYQAGAVERYALTLAVSGTTVLALAYLSSKDVRFSAFACLLTVSLLVVCYRLRLRSIQIRNGYDLAEAVGLLTAKYKMTRGNMRNALRLAAAEITSPTIRRLFLHMVRQELTYVDPREMERAVEELIYGIPTSFAKQLGLTILKGLLKGENVERTLLTIDKNIHKQIDLLRDESDSSSEVLQLSWLHVVLFPLLMALMIIFIGWKSTLHYQLETEAGRAGLMFTVLIIAASLLMAVWFRKPPNDY